MRASFPTRPLLSLLSVGFLSLACDQEDAPSQDVSPGGAPSADGGGPPADPCDITVDLSSYEHDLNLPRSSNPPGDLAPSDVPQFVALGWDDNGFLDPYNWLTNFLRVRHLKTSFYLTTTYISDGFTSASPIFLRGAWHAAWEAGHEMGNHTQSHSNGRPFSKEEWTDEIQTAFEWLTKDYEPDTPDGDFGVGIPREQIYGFRSPFLNYNNELFEVLKEEGIWYDCSIEEGIQLDEDASGFAWPYTLDEGSAAHDYAEDRGFDFRDFSLGKHPGMIELPAYALVIPPDEVADEYDFEPGLLGRILALVPEREPDSDRITGLDYNLWYDAELLKEEFLAILKYNLDQRLSGNRAPFLFGVHTDFYRADWEAVETMERRREAIEEFLDYAKSLSDVRVGTYKDVVDFIRNPRDKSCFSD